MALRKNHCVTCVTQPVTQRHTWIERSKERKVIHPQAGLPPASALSCGQATRNIRRRWRTPWTCTRACLGLSKGLPRVETFFKKIEFHFLCSKASSRPGLVVRNTFLEFSGRDWQGVEPAGHRTMWLNLAWMHKKELIAPGLK